MFDDLNRYQAHEHFNGQSTIALDGDRATGESYCIAHHLFTEDGERKLMLAYLRYRDTFVKRDGAWLFARAQPLRRLDRDKAFTSLALSSSGVTREWAGRRSEPAARWRSPRRRRRRGARPPR